MEDHDFQITNCIAMIHVSKSNAFYIIIHFCFSASVIFFVRIARISHVSLNGDLHWQMYSQVVSNTGYGSSPFACFWHSQAKLYLLL